VCQPGDRCSGSTACETSDFGAVCLEGACVECAETTDCPETAAACENYECLTEPIRECVADLECCPPDQSCSKTCTDGRCREGVTCQADIDCYEERGRYCYQGTCSPACTDPRAVCIAGHECLEGGRCGLLSCSSHEECGEGRRCVDGECRTGSPEVFECQEDEDCPNAANGGTCRGGLCWEPQRCAAQGQPDTCLGEGRVCDYDPFVGVDYIHCQDVCQERVPPACPGETLCGADGLCGAPPEVSGCMTSEMCADGERCDRTVAVPTCVPAGDRTCRWDGDCAAPEVCVDDTCADALPRVCGGAEDCDGAQVCNLLGACELAGACAQDLDCPGVLRCDPEAGGCGECSEDAECGGADGMLRCGQARSGRYRTCVEDVNGFCVSDGDCTRGRPCLDGFCTPRPCEDDWMHDVPSPGADGGPARGNHSPLHAAPIGGRTFVELRLCDGADDWFSVPLQQGQDLQASITWVVPEMGLADPYLELWKGNALVAESDGIGGSERLGLNGAPEGGDYLLHVGGNPGVAVTYSLRAEVGDICVDDAEEGATGNDSMETARPLAPGLYRDLVLCEQESGGSSTDWYLVDVEPGSSVDLRVAWNAEAGGVRTLLLDEERAAVGQGEQGEGWVSHSVDNWGGQPLYLLLDELEGNAAEISYSVRVRAELSDESKLAICRALPVLDVVWDDSEPGEAFPTLGQVVVDGDLERDIGLTNAWIGSCDPEVEDHVAAEKVWILDTTGPDFQGLPIDLTLLYLADDLDFRGIVYLRGDCLDDGSEVVCQESPRRQVQVNMLPSGIYYIVVDARGDSTGSFQLTVQVQLNTEVEPNSCDSCLNDCRLPPWEPIGDSLELSHVEGYSDDGEPHVDGSCIDRRGADFGPDVGYGFSTLRPCRFSARLDTDEFLGGLVLRDACPAREEIACNYSGRLGAQMLYEPELPAGDYTLWVKGADALQEGEYALDVSCSTPGVAPPGNVCNDPLPVAMEPYESARGDVIGVAATVIGDNVGASDALHLAAACNDGADPAGGDKIHRFSLERQATLFVTLDADYEALVTVGRRCGEPDDVVLGCGAVGGELQIWDLVPGDYFLVVDGVDADQVGTYEVGLTALDTGNVEAPDNDTCAGAEELVFQVGGSFQREGRTAGGDDDAEPVGCANVDAGAADVVYRWTADVEHILSARTLGADFDTVLYVRQADCAAGPEVACGEGAIPDVELEAGDYYLFVDGAGDADDIGSFTLEVDWLPPVGECGDNESCADALPIVLEDGSGSAEGSTAPCLPHEAPFSCGVPGEDGKDVVYSLVVEERAEVRLVLDTEWDLLLHVRGRGCGRHNELYCDSNAPIDILTDELDPGTYYVVVDTSFSDSPGGPFTLYVDVLPVGAAAVNDTCAQVDAAEPDPLHPGENGRIVLDERGEALISGTTENASPDLDNRAPGAGYAEGCAEAPDRDTAAAADVVYRLDLAEESDLEAAVRPGTLAAPALSLRGPDECEDVAAEVACVDGASTLRAEALAPGAWYLVVDGYSDAFEPGTFDLEVGVAPVGRQAENDDCATVADLPLAEEPGDASAVTGLVHGTTAGAEDDYRPAGCADPTRAGRDVVYRLELPYAANSVVVDVDAHHSQDLQRPPDLVAYLRGGDPTCEAGVEVDGGCNDNRLGVDPQIRLEAAADRQVPGGTYYLFVDGARPEEAGGFTLAVRVEDVPDAAPPANDTCAEVDAAPPDPAEPGVNGRIVLDAAGHAAIAGTTTHAGADFENRPPGGEYEAGCAVEAERDTAAAGDVVYRLDVAEESLLQARVVPWTVFRPMLTLRGPGACEDQAAEVACAEAGIPLVVERLAAGTWYLIVDGYSGASPAGTFQLTVDLTPIPQAPANDTCAGAAPIVLVEGGGDPATAAGEVQGATTVGAGDDYAPPVGCAAGGGGADVVFTFDLPFAYNSVQIDVLPEEDPVLGLPDLVAWLRGSEPSCDDADVVPAGCNDDGPGEGGFPQLLLRAEEGRPLPQGTYYLVVDGLSDAEVAASFAVLVAVEEAAGVEPPDNDTCEQVDAAAPDPAEPHVNGRIVLDGEGHAIVAGTTVAAVADYGNRPPDGGYDDGCGDGGGRDMAAAPDVVYRLDVEAESSLQVGIVPGTLASPVLSLRGPGGCADAAAEVWCGDPADVLTVDRLAPGAWYLIVDGFDAEESPGTFQLVVDLTELTPAPDNDDCAHARTIALVVEEGPPRTASGETEGATLGFADTYQPPEGCADDEQSGPDAVFRLDLPFAANNVEIDVDAHFDEGLGDTPDLVAYLRGSDPSCDEAGVVPDGCSNDGDTSDPRLLLHVDEGRQLPQGTYYLVVDGYGVVDEATGLSVNVWVEEAVGAGPPENDTCAEVDAAAPDPARPSVNGRVVLDAAGHASFAGTTLGAGADHDNRPPGGGYEAGCAAAADRDTAAAPDVVYRLDVEAESSVRAVLDALTLEAPVLSLRGPGGCDDRAVEVACVDGEATLEVERVAAGAWYLVVDGRNADARPGTFQLTVDVTEHLPPPENDDCDHAQLIALEQDAGPPRTASGEALGATVGFADTYRPPAGCADDEGSGPDAVFRLDLPFAQNNVDIELTAGVNPDLGDVPDLVAYLRHGEPSCAEAAVVPDGCNDDGESTAPHLLLHVDQGRQLPQGTYYLIVDGYGEADEATELAVTVAVEEAEGAEPPPNDTCAEVDAAAPDPAEPHVNGRVVLDEGMAGVVGSTLGAAADYDSRPPGGGYDAGCAAAADRDTAAAGDVVYRIDVGAESSLRVTVDALSLEAPVVYLRGPGGCEDRAAEVACLDGEGVLEIESVAAGAWYLVVDGYSAAGRPGTFELGVEVTEHAQAPENDDCVQPEPIVLEVDPEVPDLALGDAEGTTVGYGDSYQPPDGCAGDAESGPDAVYRLDLPFDYNEVYIELTPGWNPDLGRAPDMVAYLRTDDPSCAEGADVPDGCATGEIPEILLETADRRQLAGDTYYLFVDGLTEQDVATSFQIHVEAVAANTGLPVGDDCDALDIPVLEFDADGEERQDLYYDGDTTWAADSDADVATDCMAAQAGGRDSVVLLRLDATYDVTAMLTEAGWSGKVAIRESCADPATEVACGEEIAGPVRLAPGDYYVWVDGVAEADAGEFELVLGGRFLPVPPCNDTCEVQPADARCPDGYGPAEVDFFESCESTITGEVGISATNATRGSCGDHDGAETVYWLDLEEGAVVTAQLFWADFSPVFSLRSACDVPGSEVACAGETFTTGALPAGTYYLVVDGRTADDFDGGFSLNLLIGGPPANDTCAAPEAVSFEGLGPAEPAEVFGALTDAADDYAGTCGGAEGAELVYELELEALSTVTAEVTWGPNTIVYMTSGACDPSAGAAAEEACDAVGWEVSDLGAGTYWIHVDGETAEDVGDFGMEVYVTPQ